MFHVTPHPGWLPTSMGMGDGLASLAAATSHLLFINGMLDPWSAQSVLRDLSPTILALNVADGMLPTQSSDLYRVYYVSSVLALAF